MKAVSQEIIDSEIGDCLQACVASVLDLDAAAVPNFAAMPEPWRALSDWLGSVGYAYVYAHRCGGSSPIEFFDWRWLVGAVAIASVPSQRFPGVSHAILVTWAAGDRPGVVNMIVLHDPNPTNRSYDLGVTEITALGFLVRRS